MHKLFAGGFVRYDLDQQKLAAGGSGVMWFTLAHSKEPPAAPNKCHFHLPYAYLGCSFLNPVISLVSQKFSKSCRFPCGITVCACFYEGLMDHDQLL